MITWDYHVILWIYGFPFVEIRIFSVTKVMVTLIIILIIIIIQKTINKSQEGGWCDKQKRQETGFLLATAGSNVAEQTKIIRHPMERNGVYTYIHHWRPRLCRVFLHSAKSHLHSAKALPSVALGKVRSAKFFSAKGLCRMLFIRALGKIKKKLPSAWGDTRQNISAVVAPAVNGYFAECPTQHSAKKKIFF